MLGSITSDMLCYITCFMLCYITYVMLHSMCHFIDQDMVQNRPL